MLSGGKEQAGLGRTTGGAAKSPLGTSGSGAKTGEDTSSALCHAMLFVHPSVW